MNVLRYHVVSRGSMKKKAKDLSDVIKKPNVSKYNNSFILLGMSIGLGLGSILGILLSNILCMSIGLGVGTIIGFILKATKAR